MNKIQFQIELRQLINKHSMENGSDTPDFILSEYLMGCLETYNDIIKSRDKWYGHEKRGIDVSFPSTSLLTVVEE